MVSISTIGGSARRDGPQGNRFEGAGRGYAQPPRRGNEPAQPSAMASAFAKLQQAKGR